VNIDFLFTGKLPILLNGNKEFIAPIVPKIESQPIKPQQISIPQKPTSKSDNLTTILSQIPFPATNLPIRPFQIKGNTMEPTLFNGDWVLCTQVSNWQTIQPNEVYCIVFQDNTQCKRLRYDKTTQQIFSTSDNSFYPSQEYNLNEIKEIWQFYSLIRFFLPTPPQNTQFTQDLQNILQHLKPSSFGSH